MKPEQVIEARELLVRLGNLEEVYNHVCEGAGISFALGCPTEIGGPYRVIHRIDGAQVEIATIDVEPALKVLIDDIKAKLRLLGVSLTGADR